MKELSLNTAERLVAVGVCNMQAKIPVENLKEFYEDAAKFGLTDEDRAANKWEEIKATEDVLDESGEVVVKQGSTVSVKWDDTGVEPKTFEIGDFMQKFFKDNFAKLEYDLKDPLALAASKLWEKLNA